MICSYIFMVGNEPEGLYAGHRMSLFWCLTKIFPASLTLALCDGNPEGGMMSKVMVVSMGKYGILNIVRECYNALVFVRVCVLLVVIEHVFVLVPVLVREPA